MTAAGKYMKARPDRDLMPGVIAVIQEANMNPGTPGNYGPEIERLEYRRREEF
jgi:hypothetical protein